MFDSNAFQQDKLIAELREAGIVKQEAGDTTSPVGFAMVNHNRNANVRIELKPSARRPVLFDYDHQNPTAYVDPNRGYFGTCLRHAENYTIVCDDAIDSLQLNSSFTQTILDLTRGNTNTVRIYINGIEYTANDFIVTYGSTRTFNTTILTTYGIQYTDQVGDYRLYVIGATEVRIEVRVTPSNGFNTVTIAQAKQVFAEVGSKLNPSVEFHSNEDFYGFTTCLKSTNLPSKLNVRLTTETELNQLVDAGKLAKANLEATSISLNAVNDAESAMSVRFAARLVNDFDEELPARVHNYMLDLGTPEIPVPVNKVSVRFSRFSMAGDLLAEPDQLFPTSSIYSNNNQLLLADFVTDDGDDEYYIEYTVDIDGADELYLPYTHRLNVSVTRTPDVIIPIMVTFAKVFPRMLTTFTNVVFNTHQYYQFGVDVEAKSILTIWSSDLANQAVEFSIVNGATGAELESNIPDVNTRSGKAWHFEEAQLVIVQLKLPIGLTGTIDLMQQQLTDPFYGVERQSTGKLAIGEASNRFGYYGYAERGGLQNFKWINPLLSGSRDVHRIVQLIDEVKIGQAIAVMNSPQVMFTQDVKSQKDYDPAMLRLAPDNNGKAIVISPFEKQYAVNGAIGVVSTGATNLNGASTIVYEFRENVIRVHGYSLDDNYVPTNYQGNYDIPYVYDAAKPVSIIGMYNYTNAHIGSAYDVVEGDLGPIGSSLVTVQETDIQLVNITEVPL